MTRGQWQTLCNVTEGKHSGALPTGFIIDSPWLPNWAGMRIIDYFSSDYLWLEANMKAQRTFPDTIFLPGFWSEFGMCTEPSAFGAKLSFPPDEFPFADKIIQSPSDVDKLKVPNVKKDGLLPFMLNRLTLNRKAIEKEGYSIKFAVARGPMNIASFLAGNTEFLMMTKTDPEATHRLMRIVTDFLHEWLRLQKQQVDSIEGILLLDDIVGFVNEEDYLEFGLPYFKELYQTFETKIRFFHNDSPCASSAPHYAEAGINLYNMGIDVSLAELQKMTDNKIALLGNIPPRDVLAAGSTGQVRENVRQILENTPNRDRLILSCAGGMPPKVSTENIEAFIDGARQYS
jgi:uroporphyrinogen decarboxylase